MPDDKACLKIPKSNGGLSSFTPQDAFRTDSLMLLQELKSFMYWLPQYKKLVSQVTFFLQAFCQQ